MITVNSETHMSRRTHSVRAQREVSRDAADMLLIVVVGVRRAVKSENSLIEDVSRLPYCVLGSRCGWCRNNTEW